VWAPSQHSGHRRGRRRRRLSRPRPFTVDLASARSLRIGRSQADIAEHAAWDRTQKIGSSSNIITADGIVVRKGLVKVILSIIIIIIIIIIISIVIITIIIITIILIIITGAINFSIHYSFLNL